MGQKSFLLLSAIPDFASPRSDEALVALGTWCCDREPSLGLEGSVPILSYPFSDPLRREEAFQHCVEVSEAVLPALSRWLNVEHHLNLSVRSWRIILGFFLFRYVSNLYARYVCVKRACQESGDVRTLVMSSSSYRTPRNYLEFTGLIATSDLWNHQIFSQIVEYLQCASYTSIVPDWSKDSIVMNTAPGIGEADLPFAARLRRGVLDKANRLFPTAPVMSYIVYMSLGARLRLSLSSRLQVLQMPPMGRQVPITGEVDQERRSRMPHFGPSDEFLELLRVTLLINLPTVFLEGFRGVKTLADAYTHKKKAPRVIVTDTGWYANEVFQVWAAQSAERGSVLVGVQHGGGYGDRLCNGAERHEMACSDRYLSWGWQGESKVVPLPSLVLQKTIALSKSKKKTSAIKPPQILFACTGFLRFPCDLESGPTFAEFNEYMDWQFRFLARLEAAVRQSILMRLYHLDFMRNARELYKERFPDLRIDQPNTHHSFIDCLSEADVFICDNMNTTSLQALALDIPTLLFWDTAQWRSRASMIPHYDRLATVGIFHSSPESAAEKLNEVFANPTAWWFASDTRAAYAGYRQQVAVTSADWVAKWRGTLQGLAAHPQTVRREGAGLCGPS